MRLIKTFRNASLSIQGVVVLASLGLYFLTSYILERSYVLSLFPVPYFEQQTSFDPVKMKEWYAFMIEQGTFGIYIKTQFIDFAFIAAVILAGFTAWTFVANLYPQGSFFEKYGKKLAFALPIAGAFDVFENLVSFVMIANPESFADSIIIPYSSFAVLKFAFWALALVWLSASLLSLPLTLLARVRKVTMVGVLLLGLTSGAYSQTTEKEINYEELIYIEADPFAYLNKGYSIHLGYENWGWRFDLTKVKVDFPESFEEAFYGTKAFDLVTNIRGIKIDYIGNRSNWTKGGFIGLDVNRQNLSFEHRSSGRTKDLNTFNLGLRAGYKIPIFKGFYITPWAAIWRNVASMQEFTVGTDQISTNEWDWILTLHFGYAIKL